MRKASQYVLVSKTSSGFILQAIKVEKYEKNMTAELGWQVWQLQHQYLRDLLLPAIPIFERISIICYTNM